MATERTERDERGRYRKGTSGNPHGRPSGTAELAARVQRETGDGREVIAYLLRVLRGQEPDSAPPARLKAAEMLLQRGWGNPNQPITGDDGGPIRIALGWGESGDDLS